MLLRPGIIRIPIWMKFHGQLAIRLLDVVFAAVAVKPQHFVIITFTHISFLGIWKSRGLSQCLVTASPDKTRRRIGEKYSLFRPTSAPGWHALVLICLYFLFL